MHTNGDSDEGYEFLLAKLNIIIFFLLLCLTPPHFHSYYLCRSFCDYNSEEDRVKERLQNLQRRRHVQGEAARQMETLRRHREEREAARKMAAQGHGGCASESNINFMIDEEINEIPANNDAAAISDHELAWSKLETGIAAADNLLLNSAIWPPFKSDLRRYLSALAAFHQPTNNNGANEGGNLRRAYTKACLRWHPDKFQARFCRVLTPEELGQVMVDVNLVMEGLNQAWSEVEQES